MTQSVTIKQILGTWRLVSIYYIDNDNKKVDLFGSNPQGILMYDKHGYMNAQLGHTGRTKMSTAALAGATIEEKAAAFDSFTAYYGKYYEEAPGKIIHVVEGCTIPNWEGSKETRFVKIEGDTLLISAPNSKIGDFETVIEVVWQRVTK